MHNVTIPDFILARAVEQRGRERLFDGLDMARTAHVIVDLQNGFVAEGAPVEVPAAREIIGNVNAISDAVRRAGGINVFLRFTADPDEATPWDVYYSAHLDTAHRRLMQSTFAAGSEAHALYPGLEVSEGDLVIDKTRFSGLIPGTCDLDALLRARGIDTMIITGTLTNCCCDSTARDAMQMGYRIVFVTDGTATLSDVEHNATLISMATIFADLRTAEEVVALAAAGARSADAAE